MKVSLKKSQAIWTGFPFLLVGKMRSVQNYVNSLSANSKRLLRDHSYFWILTNTDKALKFPELPERDRNIFLNWEHKAFYVIVTELKVLSRPELSGMAGLSRGMRRVRADILRIGQGKKGPWTPTLILGDTGVGKEEIALALFKTACLDDSNKTMDPEQFLQYNCAALTQTNLEHQLFGSEAFTGTPPRKGLLQTYDHGAIQLDEFHKSPSIQGPLLRVMATQKGDPAEANRIGGEGKKPFQTWIWLIFSTKADIRKLLREGSFDQDFFFRFEDRVIVIPPLKNRPADVPAIAKRIWWQLWDGIPIRSLTPPVMEWLGEEQKDWIGNVRGLRALLSLSVSMIKHPAYNSSSLRQIFHSILSKGPDWFDWMGIISDLEFTGIGTGSFGLDQSENSSTNLAMKEQKKKQRLNKEERSRLKTELGESLSDSGRKFLGHLDKLLSLRKSNDPSSDSVNKLLFNLCQNNKKKREQFFSVEECQAFSGVKNNQTRDCLRLLYDLRNIERENPETKKLIGEIENELNIFKGPEDSFGVLEKKRGARKKEEYRLKKEVFI